MAQTWISTPWKRLTLAGLNLFARAANPLLGGLSSGTGDRHVVERILVVELWHIGDVVLTIPFLAQLRALFPKAQTTLLARSHAREILGGMGLVDEFIETDVTPAESWLTHSRLAYNLRDHKFDVAFQCRMHVREHVILAMSGARRRVGYAFGYGDHMLTDAIFADDPGRHKVADWLRLLEPFDGPLEVEIPPMHVSASERRWADEYLADRGVLATDVVIGIHPGASLPEKRWPLERFLEVANELVTHPGVRILTFVEPAGYGASLDKVQGSINAKVGLRELIALVERCAVLVCNDSGPMHIAGALGVPTVAVFGSGIAQWFSPLGEGHEVVSAGNRFVETIALGEIPAASVLEAVKRTLGRRRSKGNRVLRR